MLLRIGVKWEGEEARKDNFLLEKIGKGNAPFDI